MLKVLFPILLVFLQLVFVFPVQAYNDSPLQGLHQDIQSEMEEEEPKLLPAMEILWRGTVQLNPTLQLALQKMNEKTGQTKSKDKGNWTQGLLRSLVHLGGLGGSVALGSPAPLIGSTVLGRMTAPEVAAKRLTEVTSADLVILAREIEQAQTQLINHYLQYRQALEEYDMVQAGLTSLQDYTKKVPQEDTQVQALITSFTIDRSLKVQQALHSIQRTRQLLVLQAGEAAVAEVDKVGHNNTVQRTEPSANEQTTQ